MPQNHCCKICNTDESYPRAQVTKFHSHLQHVQCTESALDIGWAVRDEVLSKFHSHLQDVYGIGRSR